jgi:hypothetical protein
MKKKRGSLKRILEDKIILVLLIFALVFVLGIGVFIGMFSKVTGNAVTDICTGTATPCDQIAADQCAAQKGCTLVSNSTIPDNPPTTIAPGCVGLPKCSAIVRPTVCQTSSGCKINNLYYCTNEGKGDIYVKNNITVITTYGTSVHYDTCSNKTSVKQVYCKNYSVAYETEDCEFKCNDGVCLIPGTFPQDLFLLIGQSNMVGRGLGPLDPDVDMPDERIFQWGRVGENNSKWIIASHPLQHWDPSASAPIGLGLSFAKKWLELNPNTTVGLIPSAQTSTKLAEWKPGTVLYNDALARALAAESTGGTIRGILWLQGESDVINALSSATYRNNLINIINSLRTKLNNQDIPFIVGEFTPEWYNGTASKVDIEYVLNNLPNLVGNTSCVQSDGLHGKTTEIIHFDSPSLRILGERYALENYKFLNKSS